MPDAVTVSHISKRFPVEPHSTDPQVRGGYFYALDDVSMGIESGSRALVCGANGSGKSLLMSIIAGLDAPHSGAVQCGGRVGLIFQEPDSQILGETPREDIAFGLRNLKVPKKEINSRAMQALAETGLEARADYPSRALSGGEKRRLAIAGVLAMDAQIIIFDEPYANMDYPSVVQINQHIQKLHSSGKTVIILTHEIEKCLGLADSFIVLHKGRKVFDGTPTQALGQDLEAWGIHNPLRHNAGQAGELLWL